MKAAEAKMIAQVAFHRPYLKEISGICSLIFLSDAYVVTSVEEARQIPITACEVERGYAQQVLYAFHPELYPEIKGYLREAGWKYLCQWQSAHPGPQGPMELWAVLTGQEQR